MLGFFTISTENSPYLVMAKLIKLYQLIVFTDANLYLVEILFSE